MDIKKNITLVPFTTFHIGGSADFFITVSSKEEIMQAITFAQEKALPFFVLGTGANILVGDKGFRGVVIKNEAKKIMVDDAVSLTVESGATIADLITFTREKGLSGFEHFAGIPSSVGGALWQNLHFLSPDRSRTFFISEILQSAEIVLRQPSSSGLVQKKVDASYFQFGYDYSILHDTHDIVLEATFLLQPEKTEVIQLRIDANLQWRQQKHPKNATKKSAGSIFKKLEGYGAGRLIEKVGLKGYAIGGAMVSEKHANFIVNTGNATASDVRSLIDLIQKKVQAKVGLQLQTEISFIGEF